MIKRTTEENSETIEDMGGEDTPKKRKVVVPGEIIASGQELLPGDGTRLSTITNHFTRRSKSLITHGINKKSITEDCE